jgi:hypothetical protein
LGRFSSEISKELKGLPGQLSALEVNGLCPSRLVGSNSLAILQLRWRKTGEKNCGKFDGQILSTYF